MIVSVLAVLILSATESRATGSEVSGIFKGNDQAAKLAFVSAHKGTRIAGKETIQLVFTDKDHSHEEQPALKALFGGYGSALVIGIQFDGKVVTCDVVHEALKQKAISPPASVKMREFKNEAGGNFGKAHYGRKGRSFGPDLGGESDLQN